MKSMSQYSSVGLLLCGVSTVLLTTAVVASSDGLQVKVSLPNQSGSQLSLNWINPSTKAPTHFADIPPEENLSFNTFLGHQFQLQERPINASSTMCANNPDGICRVKNFNITRHEAYTIIIKPGLKIESKANVQVQELPAKVFEQARADSVAECQEKAKELLARAGSSTERKHALQVWKQCLQEQLTVEFEQVDEDIRFHQAIRLSISGRMENYTCIDSNLGTSPDLEQRDWINQRDGKTRKVHVKLERPASRIHVVEDFASAEECAAVENTARPLLRNAAVADGKGGSQVSKSRKAMQAGLTPNWSMEAKGDLIASLNRRVYDYANHVLGLGLEEHGQEPLMSIQYFGRGYNDTQPDRYVPHCDGQCDGDMHKYGTRMATMVVYCTIPEGGGHTNFQNSAVHVKPAVGNAIFFSYMDPETKITDMGLTSHSGCPVYVGTKKIAVQWLRYGVDAENPWDSLNTLGVKDSETVE